MIRVLIFTISLAMASAASNMIFKKIDVQVGAVGSDDTIKMKICDRSKCCTTKELYHTFGSEWVANRLETWDGSDLGDCREILFDDKLTNVDVSILKDLDKKDALQVTNMTLSAQIGSDKKKIQKYVCGSYKFTAKDGMKTNSCLEEKSLLNKKAKTKTPLKPKVSLLPLGVPDLLVKKIVVQVGNDGTDDDIFMKICDSQKCCKTDKLHHVLSGEWRKNQLETWEGGKLGDCRDILFLSGATDLKVSVLKDTSKKDPLDITSIVIETSLNSNKKKVEKFKCGAYKLGETDKEKINTCPKEGVTKSVSQTRTTKKPTTTRKPTAAELEKYKVNTVVVQMGDDGTNDDVALEICNKNSVLKCCDTGKLSSFLSDDWSRGDKETWKDLGPCSKKLFDACQGFDVAVKKLNGKDSFKVTNITLNVAEKDKFKDLKKFVCKDNYNFGPTDTVKRSTCTLDRTSSLSCPKTTVSSKRKTSIGGNKPSPKVTKPSSGSTTSGKDRVILKGFEVQVGRDGTRDKVTAKVCSAVDKNICCETGVLSNGNRGNNWLRNGNETWPAKSLGSCNNFIFPVETRTTFSNRLESTLILTLRKAGINGMKLENFNLEATSADEISDRRFKCGKIQVVDTNTATKECYAQYSKPTPTTPRTGPCLRSGRNCGTSKSTTRAPFRSVNG